VLGEVNIQILWDPFTHVLIPSERRNDDSKPAYYETMQFLAHNYQNIYNT
jgi:hypothetical protein